MQQEQENSHLLSRGYELTEMMIVTALQDDWESFEKQWAEREIVLGAFFEHQDIDSAFSWAEDTLHDLYLLNQKLLTHCQSRRDEMLATIAVLRRGRTLQSAYTSHVA